MECKHKIQLKSGIIVPCGKCPSCLANQRQEWVFRLQQEFLDSKFSIFVTLTYNDEHIPLDLSVNKEDVQLFHKRLRKHFPSGDLRFYLVSEYGENGTLRPHYHGLYFFRSDYQLEYIYDIFEKSWSKGFIKFGNVEEGSIVYCTKYCLKHSTTPPGRKDTFRLMSKMNGGIGSGYLQRMSDFHIENDIYSYVAYNGKKCRMPRYYRSKLPVPLNVRENIEYNAIILRNKEFIDGFKDFIRDKHFETLEAAKQAYISHSNLVAQNQDSLVLKHCKKQKL